MCQHAKVTTQPSTTLEKISIPEQQLSHVDMDLVGPWLTASAGYRYLLTVIDRSTRWFEATTLQEITAEAVLDCFVSSWIHVWHVVYVVHRDAGGSHHDNSFSPPSQ